MTGPATGLAALNAQLERDLVLLTQPVPNWIRPRRHESLGEALDVAIIGAGMSGMTAAFALLREGVRNLRLFDASKQGIEGPWVTWARMETLRSPKQLTGPCLGLPSLTFRAWYEAQFGEVAWEALGRIPRAQWMEYLRWYRAVLGLPVENEVRMTGLRPEGDLVVLDFADGRQVAARHVVLANGRDGLGGPAIPAMFAGLPARMWAHTSAAIDFRTLRGKRVAVLGAGASAFDNAAEAQEAGAAEVCMLMRRKTLPRINKGMGVSSPGMNLGYYDLPPDQRLAITEYLATTGSTPSRASVLRCFRLPNFRILAECGVTAAREEGGQVVLGTVQGEMRFDFLILGTGFVTDMTLRPELSGLVGRVRLWGDEVPASRSYRGRDYADTPYLGRYLEFLPNTAEDDWVRSVTCLTFSGTISHYKLTGDIPAISDGARRVAEGIIRRFFVEDFDDHYQRLIDHLKPEVLGDEWPDGVAI